MRRLCKIYCIANVAMMMFFISSVHADYQKMRREFENYTPNAYFNTHQRSIRPLVEKKSSELSDFMRVKERLRKVQANWKRTLSANTANQFTFLPISPAQMENYRQIASDENSIRHLFQAPFALKDLEALVLLRNPGIKAQKNHVKAAIATITQTSNLDEILRQYSAFTEGLMTGVGPMKGNEPLKAKFPFPAVLALKGQIAQQEVKAAYESLEASRRDTVTKARKTYWNLVFIRKSQLITRETVDFLQQLEDVATTRYKAGKTSFQDVIKVEIRRKILEDALLTLGEKQRHLELTILELVNLTPEITLGTPQTREPKWETPPPETLYPLALERRQELRRMRAMIGKMERMVAMAEIMILPQYTLNYSVYEDQAVIQTGSGAIKETFAVSVSASRGAGLPKMPWYGTDDAFLRQTRQKLMALKNELNNTAQRTATRVQKAWYKTDQARREAALYRNTVVGLARSALDVSVRGYESGRVSFADVIGSYTDWLQARLALARRISDIGVARAELARTVGSELNEKINVRHRTANIQHPMK